MLPVEAGTPVQQRRGDTPCRALSSACDAVSAASTSTLYGTRDSLFAERDGRYSPSCPDDVTDYPSSEGPTALGGFVRDAHSGRPLSTRTILHKQPIPHRMIVHTLGDPTAPALTISRHVDDRFHDSTERPTPGRVAIGLTRISGRGAGPPVASSEFASLRRWR